MNEYTTQFKHLLAEENEKAAANILTARDFGFVRDGIYKFTGEPENYLGVDFIHNIISKAQSNIIYFNTEESMTSFILTYL